MGVCIYIKKETRTEEIGGVKGRIGGEDKDKAIVCASYCLEHLFKSVDSRLIFASILDVECCYDRPGPSAENVCVCVCVRMSVYVCVYTCVSVCEERDLQE